MEVVSFLKEDNYLPIYTASGSKSYENLKDVLVNIKVL